MNKIYKTGVYDLLPESIKRDKKVEAAARAIDSELLSLTNAINEVMIYSRIDELPETVINMLAWQFHVDFYSSDLSLEKKRMLVKKSIDWHRRKGTIGVVEEVVTTAFSDATVDEWHEYGGNPYLFRVKTKERVASEKKWNDIVKAINSVKNTRSWLDKIILEMKQDSNLNIALIPRPTKTTKLFPSLQINTEDTNLNVGVILLKSRVKTIKPVFELYAESTGLNFGGVIKRKKSNLIRPEGITLKMNDTSVCFCGVIKMNKDNLIRPEGISVALEDAKVNFGGVFRISKTNLLKHKIKLSLEHTSLCLGSAVRYTKKIIMEVV